MQGYVDNVAEACRTDVKAFIKRYADFFRDSDSHDFPNGKPDHDQSLFFVLRVLLDTLDTKLPYVLNDPTLILPDITSPNFSPELATSLKRFSENYADIPSVFTGKTGLKFFSHSGGRKVSLDIGDPQSPTDMIGQILNVGEHFYNNLFGDWTSIDRDYVTRIFIKHYNTDVSPIVSDCIKRKLSDDDANTAMAKGLGHSEYQRGVHVDKLSTIVESWTTTEAGNKRKGRKEILAVSTLSEAEEFCHERFSICETTGIPGWLLDVTLNRSTDDKHHDVKDCILNLVCINRAVITLGIFDTEETLDAYCRKERIDRSIGTVAVFNFIVRPYIEDFIRFQAKRLGLDPPFCMR